MNEMIYEMNHILNYRYEINDAMIFAVVNAIAKLQAFSGV